jgi:hypothetical protein
MKQPTADSRSGATALLSGPTAPSQPASSEWEVLRDRLFAALDVVGAGTVLLVLGAAMVASALGSLLFITVLGEHPSVGAFLADLGYVAFLALTFLVSWRLFTPLQAFFSRRWNVLVAVGKKAQ